MKITKHSQQWQIDWRMEIIFVRCHKCINYAFCFLLIHNRQRRRRRFNDEFPIESFHRITSDLHSSQCTSWSITWPIFVLFFSSYPLFTLNYYCAGLFLFYFSKRSENNLLFFIFLLTRLCMPWVSLCVHHFHLIHYYILCFSLKSFVCYQIVWDSISLRKKKLLFRFLSFGFIFSFSSKIK